MPIDKTSNNQPPIDDAGECSNSKMNFKSLVSVDMKKFSQSELYSLSRSSSDAFDLSENDVPPDVIKSIHRPACAIITSTTTTTPRRIFAFSHRRRPSIPDTPVRENKSILNSIEKLMVDGDTAATALAPPPVDSRSEVSKRKRKRKLKSENEIEGLGVINVNGESVDLKYLAQAGDGVFGSELNKMTEGMVTEDEFLGLLKGLEGRWGSTRRRRKVVDARVFAKLLPDNWKILLSLRPRASQPSLYCREFVSPSGNSFKTCNEVAFYLQSLFLTNNPNHMEEGAIVLVEPDDQVDPESVARVHRSSNPVNGGASSSGTKNNSEMNRTLKTRCVVCLDEFVCNPAEADTLPGSWGFICPKCSLARLAQRANN